MSADLKVIRKIAALLARGEDAASSPAEIEIAMRLAHKLMQQHNLTRDEVRLRKEEMARQDHVVPCEDTPFLNPIIFAISRLTHTRCALTHWKMRPDEFTFRGLRVDVEYASWLLRTVIYAQKQGWSAYQASPAFAGLIAKAATPTAIHLSFMQGFSADLTRRIKALAASDAAVTNQALVVLKDKLIDQAFGVEAQEKHIKRKPVAITADLAAAFRSGASFASTVPIRQEISGAGSPGKPGSAPVPVRRVTVPKAVTKPRPAAPTRHQASIGAEILRAFGRWLGAGMSGPAPAARR